jgi:serine/threonine protein phosphatase PrpC
MKRRNKKVGLLLGYRSHVGQVRELNEDSYLAMAAPAITREIDALLIVADGVGGHQAGEVASGYVVNTLRQLFTSPAYQTLVDYDPQREDYYAAALKEILEQINTGLQEMAVRRRGLSGMGTTATVALVTGRRLFIGHVGDTRAYLLRRGELHLLTTDHSWVEDQVQAGALTPQQAAKHPRRGALTRSLGNRPVVRIDRSIHALMSQDALLLCSDGLTNKVSDAEIRKAVLANADPQKACDVLVDLANQRGGEDNITVLLMKLSDEMEGSNLPGGVAAGSRAIEASAEAATTKKIRRPAVSRRAPQATMRGISATFLFALLAAMSSMLSGLAVYLLAELLGTGQVQAVAVCSALWTTVGILIGLVSARCIRRN